jgi:hypothetical protein
LVEEIGVSGENHRPPASHWQTLSVTRECCVLFFFVLCTLCCQFLCVFVLFFFVLCTLCCQFLWIVVAIRLFIVGLCVSCTQCFHCHWIIHCWSLCFVFPMFPLSLDYSLLVSVFRVSNVSLVIRLFIVGLCVSCTQCFPCH